MTDVYRGLRFSRGWVNTHRKFVAMTVAAGLFTLVWLTIPGWGLYWLLLPIQVALVWMAGYGWRQALSDLRGTLYRLEQL